MNPLIELYNKMLNDPGSYELMQDPDFIAKSAETARDATPKQHKEFDEYVNAHLQAQLEKLNRLGEHYE